MISIEQYGNLLTITPANEVQSLLESMLTCIVRDCSPVSYNKRRFTPKTEITCQPVKLFSIDNNTLFTFHGFLPKIVSVLQQAKYEFTIKHQTLKPLNVNLENLAAKNITLRGNQNELINAIINNNNGIIVAPTGFGKSFLICAICAIYYSAKIVVAVPSIAILNGLYRRLKLVVDDIGRLGAGYSESGHRVMISTYQSILSSDLKNCDILLVDECHKIGLFTQVAHDIASAASPVKIFGFTATPKGRSDGSELAIEGLIGPIIATVHYAEAVNGSYIAPIKVIIAQLNRVAQLNNALPDIATYKLRIAKKRWAYWRNNVRNLLIAKSLQYVLTNYHLRPNPQILILVETVEHAFRLQKYLPDFTLIYASMSNKVYSSLVSTNIISKDYKPLTAKERRDLQLEFESDRLKKVIATGCWGEGVDFVYLDIVVNAAGLYSPITTIQWAGRGSRINEAKECGYLIDILDSWSTWTESKSRVRIREYKKRQWSIETIDGVKLLCQNQMQQPLGITS